MPSWANEYGLHVCVAALLGWSAELFASTAGTLTKSDGTRRELVSRPGTSLLYHSPQYVMRVERGCAKF